MRKITLASRVAPSFAINPKRTTCGVSVVDMSIEKACVIFGNARLAVLASYKLNTEYLLLEALNMQHMI